MKKLLSILLAAALLLPVLAGCQRSAEPAPQAGASANTPGAQQIAPSNTVAPAPTKKTAPSVTYITPEEAKAIALQDAGLKESDVRDLEVDLDRDDGTVHYDVDFEKSGDDYDYDIDARTGEILRVEKPVKSGTSAPTSSESAEKQLTQEEAQNIALKHAGVKASEVRYLDVELDKDDDTVHYDVDFEKDGYDYEYEIDAKTGKILKSRKERD